MQVHAGGSYLQWSFPTLPYIVSNGVLPAETKAVLFGPPKKGKSLLTNQLAISVLHGKDWMGFKTAPKKILYCNFEVPHNAWQTRLRKYCRATHTALTDNLLLVSNLKGIKINTPTGQMELEREISVHQPQLLIADPWFKMLSGGGNTAGDIEPGLDFLDRMIDEYKLTVLIVAHSRKTLVTKGGAVDFGSQELSGAYQLAQWMDTIITLIPLDRTGERIQLQFECRRGEDEVKPVNLKLNRSMAGFEVLP